MSPSEPVTSTYGLVKQPLWLDAIVDVSKRDQSIECRGYDWLGPRPEVPRFLVVHRAQCPPDGSNEPYFDQVCCPALTDLEVTCTTGYAKRFVRRGNAPSGWANGRVVSPYGDALAYLNYYGWDLDQVNRDGEACEVSGYFIQPGSSVITESPVSMQCLQWLAQWFAWRADQYGISWQTFPIIPGEGGRSYITLHKEWTIGTGKICPGNEVSRLIPTIIEMARAIMKAAQTTGQAVDPPVNLPQYAAIWLPEWWDDQLKRDWPSDAEFEGVQWKVLRRNFRMVKDGGTRRFSRPDTSSPVSGPKVITGQKVRVQYQVISEGRTFLQELDGSYLLASGFSPRATFSAR